MNASALIVQLLNGLASASSLFLISAGLTLIFGVTRIVNFAHGSLYMLGVYVACALVQHLPGLGFWMALPLTALLVGLLGLAIEMTLLKRIYQSQELYQLLLTFALVLLIKDAALWCFGPVESLGPRAPGLEGTFSVLGRSLPQYDVFLIAMGPLVLILLWWGLNKTRWGMLVRAATQDREMVSLLGVNQAWLFSSVFALGAVLAGLAGALQMPKEPASLDMDLNIIGSVFVVVVVGGMGSVVGAFLASLLVCEIKALCIGFGVVHALGLEISLSKFTLVAEFIVMAVVLVLRPWGLMGKPLSTPRALTKDFGSLQWTQTSLDAVLICCCAVLALLPLTSRFNPYWMVLANDIMIAALFALSLFLIMGPAGMPSFGHAAFLGLGGYATALLVIHAGWPTLWVLCVAPLLSVLAAMLMGWFVVRLSGVYMAMLTLAFAQIVWAGVFQWDALTAGSNGLLGVWPSGVLAQRDVFYGLTWLVLVFGFAGVRWMLKSPFGLALLASRDSPLRAQAIGLDVRRDRWLVLLASAWVAGWAGALLAFSKGSISPDSMQVTRSVDGLVMVLLGGMQASLGALLGAVAYVSLQDHLLRSTEYWRAALGAGMLVLVLLMPHGLMGFGRQCFEKCQAMRRKWA